MKKVLGFVALLGVGAGGLFVLLKMPKVNDGGGEAAPKPPEPSNAATSPKPPRDLIEDRPERPVRPDVRPDPQFDKNVVLPAPIQSKDLSPVIPQPSVGARPQPLKDIVFPEPIQNKDYTTPVDVRPAVIPQPSKSIKDSTVSVIRSDNPKFRDPSTPKDFRAPQSTLSKMRG